MNDENQPEFAKIRADRGGSLLREFFAMMKQNKKFWLGPIIAILLLFGLLVTLGSSAAAPFIYSLF